MLMDLAIANAPEAALFWERASDMATAADGGPLRGINALQNFEDDRIAGILELCRMIARTMIILTAFLAVAFWAYACYLLVSSGGDEQRLDKGREVFRRVLVGSALGISSYLLVSIAVNVYVGATGLEEIITFWDASVFDEGVGYGELVVDNMPREIALTGEVLLITDGDRPVVCKRSLDTEAIDEGWSYVVNLIRTPGPTTGATEPVPRTLPPNIPGCVRASPY